MDVSHKSGLQILHNLVAKVKAGTPSSSFNWFQQEWQLQDRAAHRTSALNLDPISDLPQKWRHWKPGKIQHVSVTTQAQLEAQLKKHWARRLLSWLVPHISHFHHMVAVFKDKD